MNCVVCSRSTSMSGYSITRYAQGRGQTEQVAPPVSACSLICLIKWAYEETAHQGVSLAVGLKSKFDELMGMLRGGR